MVTNQVSSELANSRVNSVAEKVWREALAQPEFAKVQVIYGYAPMSSSDHRNGRCCDFMITIPGIPRDEQVQIGNAIRAYFVKHAARLHVQGIIWNRKVTGFPIGGGTSSPDVTYRGPSGVARTYSGPSLHTDHVHVQVSGKAVTKWLEEVTAKPARPAKPTAYPKPSTKVVYVSKLNPGQKDSDSVWWVQKALDVPLTGDYDKATVDAVKAFQKELGDDVDGDLGPLQTTALFRKHDLGVSIEAKP